MSDESIRIPLHQALAQPVLVSGAEREFTILVGFMAAIIWVAGKSFWAFILAVFVWCIGMAIGRVVAKNDPQGIKVFLKHIKYREYYLGTEKLHAPIRTAISE